MIIKKYKAATQNEAILMAKEDLGSEAIVMNIKTIKPKGLFSIFKKTKVELTAAIDENTVDAKKEAPVVKPTLDKEENRFNNAFQRNSEKDYNEDAQNAIEEKINTIAKLLEQQIGSQEKNVSVNVDDDKDFEKIDGDTEEEKSDGRVVNLIKTMLVDNEVSPEIADALVADFEDDGIDHPLDNLLATVYQKIVLKLGQVTQIAAEEEKKPKIIFFVGNTGVGKTTTMAKLASKCKLENKHKVAMMSVDTYRIAAIEQIKTYANIIDVPMEVVYTPDDMKNYVEKYKDCDLIFVDTAGRSHRNKNQRKDLLAIIDSVQDYDKEIYLVLSVTVKYGDMINIAKTYSDMFDYRIIFTKLDETRELGSILNLKLDTGMPLSYVTWGQNVPDDIGLINPQTIAKKLLGGAK